MAGEPPNGNGKGSMRIKILSVVVAALVWYVITKNITIIATDNTDKDENATGTK